MCVQVRNHFDTLMRGVLIQNEVVYWWSLLEWSKWTMMDDQTLRCRLKWQKPGAVPGYWGLHTSSGRTSSIISIYIYLRMIDWWPPDFIGVLFAVGDRSYGALPSARIRQLVVSYLGHYTSCALSYFGCHTWQLRFCIWRVPIQISLSADVLVCYRRAIECMLKNCVKGD